ncbi:MAG TPA: inositol-3-phosphate synthase [Actinophytocola sp.]|uniref:inositol-3-phosphate synthase n=1 Tax=Actinophytocola sp. TaxID=1872138 RepID=UPI002DB8C0A2|nr:inositol-3-phosphate synthase [Actinophytocola sp.]HEU5472436.1 inositol-3-phosphate synthase [Actinophytocola sp.]
MAGRTGVWLVGARGSLAVTAIAGAAAVRAGLVEPIGLVGETPALAAAGLPPLSDLVFGGHDVADTPLTKRAERLVAAGVLPAALPAAVAADLAAAEAEIRPGAHRDDGHPQAGTVERLCADLVAFRTRNELDRVVVINVSSTEPVTAPRPEHADRAALDKGLLSTTDLLPASSLYAYAAFTAGCPFVDFTPSTGARLPALHALALRERLPYAGSDGKTGETLVKSALAPMFAARALRVLSWSGTNLLGGGDGATLADPRAAASKTAAKQRGLGEMLGYPVDGQTHIDYVADLGDWKTAWDHVTFAGFLGVRMSLQFTWQGCDSALAAPLVLDLARLTARAHRAGLVGPLGALAFFFKDPVGSTEHRIASQYDQLCAWAAALP